MTVFHFFLTYATYVHMVLKVEVLFRIIGLAFNSTCPLSTRTGRRWIKRYLVVDLDVVKLGLSL